MQRIGSAAVVLFALSMGSVTAKGPIYVDPDKADDDFAIQGEYVGQLGGTEKIGIQVIALGKHEFRGVAYFGGLPGDGWEGGDTVEATATAEDGELVFSGDFGTVTVGGGEIVVRDPGGTETGKLKRIVRKSPTLGKKPPAGAVVLFDGTTADAFEKGRLSDDGHLMEGAMSKERFGSHRLHLEFRLPYQPLDRGQGRGNSGVYAQGRYEVQVLDSFGLEGKHNECGGIYSVGDPAVNMCLPPLQWQTYDIDFTAAEFDDDGQLVRSPRMTVRHNGVVVHDDIELPGDRSTTAAPVKPGPEPGPLFLQNHGCPVRFRNIWVQPK